MHAIGGCERDVDLLGVVEKKFGMTDCDGGSGGGTVLVMATSGVDRGLSKVMRRARDSGSCRNGGGTGNEVSHSPTVLLGPAAS